ncbi:type II toxin-antitoxin system VapC family toxin [Lacihabitans sp. LS3-19]|uniref:type II toxin-antitoxin system VapC family toxin n=1 Tax=Lacihabitans sp. LS3-19 TaxID=2487335 RepID=UPI0028850FA4|nr:type II toxin-antitoxin system VapC family toxin [Lacihabitans sp. LS3-19]
MYRSNQYITKIAKNIGSDNFAISDVTIAELLYGARNQQELKTLRKDLNNINSIRINELISELSIQLIDKYSLSHNLNLPDSLIAATSILNEMEFFTLNIKDFKFIEGIKLYQFTPPPQH